MASPTPAVAATPEPEVIQPIEAIEANPVRGDAAAATDAPAEDAVAQ